MKTQANATAPTKSSTKTAVSALSFFDQGWCCARAVDNIIRISSSSSAELLLTMRDKPKSIFGGYYEIG